MLYNIQVPIKYITNMDHTNSSTMQLGGVSINRKSYEELSAEGKIMLFASGAVTHAIYELIRYGGDAKDWKHLQKHPVILELTEEYGNPVPEAVFIFFKMDKNGTESRNMIATRKLANKLLKEGIIDSASIQVFFKHFYKRNPVLIR